MPFNYPTTTQFRVGDFVTIIALHPPPSYYLPKLNGVLGQTYRISKITLEKDNYVWYHSTYPIYGEAFPAWSLRRATLTEVARSLTKQPKLLDEYESAFHVIYHVRSISK